MAREEREWTREEVSAHAQAHDALLVIDNVVYDVTEWQHEHPGGRDVLLRAAGGDASQCFHAVGHSDEARARMRRYAAGALAPLEHRAPAAWASRAPAPAPRPLTLAALWAAAGPPLLLAAAAALLYWGLF